jgi:chaperonin GroES
MSANGILIQKTKIMEGHMVETRIKIRPLHDRILVKRLNEEEKTKGGIIIPDSAKEKPQEGEVVAVGNGRVSKEGNVQKLDVRVGEKVLFSKNTEYSGNVVHLDGEEYLIMKEEDVLGIVS